MTDKPKRPLSAYMLWLNSARDSIKRETPGIKVTEVAKRGGELWRAMKDKSEWEAKAAQAKENYEEAIREFEANGGGGTSAANGNAKKRGKATKKVAKKTKKAASDDDDDEEESD